jgi:hypothetical protein
MAVVKNKDTEENRKFWDHVEKVAKQVRERRAVSQNELIDDTACQIATNAETRIRAAEALTERHEDR